MSVPATSNNIYGISDSLYNQADQVLSDQASTLELKNALAQETQNIAISNLAEQVSAGDWQSGIRTEKTLLGNGVSLAKA
jgi:hypothetical protein